MFQSSEYNFCVVQDHSIEQARAKGYLESCSVLNLFSLCLDLVFKAPPISLTKNFIPVAENKFFLQENFVCKTGKNVG